MTETNDNVKVTRVGGDKGWIFFLVFALIIYAIGVYLGFIKSAGFVRTTGVVVSVRAEEHYDSERGKNVATYYSTVRYTVDGKEYTGELDIGNAGGGIGEEVSIQYNPEDPGEVNMYSPGIVILIFAVGTGILAIAILPYIMNKKRERETA